MKKRFILLTLLMLTPMLALAQASTATASTNNFVSLTALPQLSSIVASNSLTGLFNNLYKICIGAAALIAVFQIVRAGVMYMAAGDNTEAVSGARKLIGNSLMGLLLVLSPYIVFSIINPSILSLQINGISNLTTSTPSTSTNTNPDGSTSMTIWECSTSAACTNAGGSASTICYNSSANIASAWNGKYCASGYNSAYSCSVQGSGCIQTQQALTAATTVSCPTYTAGQAITSGCESGCVGPTYVVQIANNVERCELKNPSTATGATVFPTGLTNIQGNDTTDQNACKAQSGCSLSAQNTKTGMYICSC